MSLTSDFAKKSFWQCSLKQDAINATISPKMGVCFKNNSSLFNMLRIGFG